MAIDLRDYQKECLKELTKHKKQLIQLPTGAGKTIVFLSYLREVSKKCLIIVPTIDLKNQVYESALNMFHESEIFIRDKDQPYEEAPLTIIVSQSLRSNIFRDFAKDQKFDHIIIDEAHKAFSSLYMDFLDFYNHYFSAYKLIGFTATPERSDRKPLLQIFEKFTYKKTIYELIEKKYLCDLKCFRVFTKNSLESDGKSGDFKMIELKHLDNYSRNKLVYDTYFQNCIGKKTLIFCISVDHAEKMADYLRKEKGIKAHHVSGLQSGSHRKEILEKFRSGEIEVITNCQLLTEGFDEPSIEALIIARPTKSKSLYCQMVGRGTRLFPGKSICEVYELTDNTHRICTFNVAADDTKEADFTREYRQGILLTELHKEISQISLSDYILEKREVPILNTFTDFLNAQGLTDSIKKKLDEQSLKYINPITFMQGAFLVFLNNLKEKYGIN